jgi:ElaB/YqjD/DUF883 family membrane-anchored ribosome-binding protein
MRSNGTTAALPSAELIKEINALKAQLKKVSVAMEADATEGVSRAVGTIESKSKEAIDDVIESAQNLIDQYAGKIEQYAGSAKDYAASLGKKSEEFKETAASSLVENVQARPFGTLAAVIGIGFLAGYLCRRG